MQDAASNVFVELFTAPTQLLETVIGIEEIAERGFTPISTVGPASAKRFKRLNHETRDRHYREAVLVLCVRCWLDIALRKPHADSLGYLDSVLGSSGGFVIPDCKASGKFGRFWIVIHIPFAECTLASPARLITHFRIFC